MGPAVRSAPGRRSDSAGARASGRSFAAIDAIDAIDAIAPCRQRGVLLGGVGRQQRPKVMGYPRITPMAFLIGSRELVGVLDGSGVLQRLIALDPPGGFLVDVAQGGRIQPRGRLEGVLLHDRPRLRRHGNRGVEGRDPVRHRLGQGRAGVGQHRVERALERRVRRRLQHDRQRPRPRQRPVGLGPGRHPVGCGAGSAGKTGAGAAR